MSAGQRKVIMDVDTGIDDALGIMLAVGSGSCDILGITTVNGNVSMQQATTNTFKILQLIDRTDIPVFAGGLIRTADDVEQALAAGATAVTTSNDHLFAHYRTDK